ncbi:hypothetical protein NEOLI_000380 [Neolecta irregularis DAH-3]|uniref:Secreted protein n=1 Tax=Neolecta irregularis (strain DAH-3) TaxID=1198029 RepID=A0A1U7LUP7_NEOID|nr:hypothetical protein NEOLI_000380 [Neolecta irregularis DAH-3]|eukprot:OLL26303.1 hypothetical protein NEOLI_000380 [Neolecta irregularis DAH-3]
MKLLSILSVFVLYIFSVKAEAGHSSSSNNDPSKDDISIQVIETLNTHPPPRQATCTAECLKSQSVPLCCAFALVTYPFSEMTQEESSEPIFNRTLGLTPGGMLSSNPGQNTNAAVFQVLSTGQLQEITTGRYGTWKKAKEGLNGLEFKTTNPPSANPDDWSFTWLDMQFRYIAFGWRTAPVPIMCKLDSDAYYRSGTVIK